jgi:flagellar hook-basal body complex protein FliE
MENEEINSLVLRGIQETGPAAAKPAEGAPRGAFEAILGEVAQEMAALKEEAQQAAQRLESKALKETDGLKTAFQDAGKNFRSAMKVGQNLVKAYQATLDAMEAQREL